MLAGVFYWGPWKRICSVLLAWLLEVCYQSLAFLGLGQIISISAFISHAVLSLCKSVQISHPLWWCSVMGLVCIDKQILHHWGTPPALQLLKIWHIVIVRIYGPQHNILVYVPTVLNDQVMVISISVISNIYFLKEAFIILSSSCFEIFQLILVNHCYPTGYISLKIIPPICLCPPRRW